MDIATEYLDSADANKERAAMSSDAPIDLTTLTVELLSSYVAHNNVRHEDLSSLISTTHAALTKLGTPEPAEAETKPAVEEHEPAVTARKSLASRDHILSMIDGKPYKSLKRHLGTRGLTPEQYRERYKLPASYPMCTEGDAAAIPATTSPARPKMPLTPR